MAETWPYVAILGAATSSGHLILFLFLLFRRKKVREGKLALLYLGLGLLWAAVVALTDLQAILPTRFRYRGIQPYVLAGFSGKWYGFGEPSPENTVEAILPSDGYTASGELGAGVTVPLLGFTFDLQVKDSINRYWGKTQHDLVFSGGLVWALARLPWGRS